MKNKYVVKRTRRGYNVNVRLRDKNEVDKLISFLSEPLISIYTISFRKEIENWQDCSYMAF